MILVRILRCFSIDIAVTFALVGAVAVPGAFAGRVKSETHFYQDAIGLWEINGIKGENTVCWVAYPVGEEEHEKFRIYYYLEGDSDPIISATRQGWWLDDGEEVVVNLQEREKEKPLVELRTKIMTNKLPGTLYITEKASEIVSLMSNREFIGIYNDRGSIAVPLFDFSRAAASLEGCRERYKATSTESEAMKPEDGIAHALAFDLFPAASTYSGRVKLPDFNKRDRAYREYRTRIREALAKQRSSNFAGKYNLVPIGLTGGIVFVVVDSKTGHIKFSDVLGGWPCDFAFKENSRLLVVQWSNAEKCYIESFEWTGTQMRQVGEALEAPIDREGYCRDRLPNADTSWQR